MVEESNLANTNTPLYKKLMPLLTHEVAILVYLGIAISLLLANDYGLYWADYFHETYARHTIEMYLGKRAPGDTIMDLRFYGPGYNVLWLLARDLFVKVFPSWHAADAGHFIYWLTFLPAPLIVYGLSRRFVGRIPSFTAALLFASQPVIFGSAFVNPKDTPFMTAFVLALWLGLLAVDLSAQSDRWLPLARIPSEAVRVNRRLADSWRVSTPWVKFTLGILWTILILLFLDLLMTHGSLQWLFILIERAYTGQAFGPLQALFNTLAQDAFKTPLAAYLDKARTFYLWARFPVLLGGAENSKNLSVLRIVPVS